MSGSLDPSIYQMVGRPAVQAQSPFEAVAQAGRATAAINQNRLFQAQVAAGQALQQATDPATGQVDPLKYNRLLAMAPQAAPAMAEAASQSQAMQGQQQALQVNRAAAMNSALSSVMALPDDQLHAGSSAAIQRLVTQGVVPAFQGASMAQQLDSLTDPKALRSRLNQIQLSMQAPADQTTQLFGSPDTQGNGQTNYVGVRAPTRAGGGFTPSTGIAQMPGPQLVNTGGAMVPTAGGRQIGPGIQTGLSPAQLATPTQIGTNPDGSAIMGTLGQFLDKAQPQSPLGTGRMPPALLNPNKPQAATGDTSALSAIPGLVPAAPSVVPPSPAGGGITVGVGPAKQAAMSAQGAASAGAFQQIADQSVQAKSQNATLGNMLADSPQFTSGMTGVNNFKMTMQRQAPAIAKAFGIDPKEVSAMESFDKLAAQIAAQQGAGTDARLAVAQSGNPSSKLTQEGVDQMLRQLQGNADYLQARAALAAKYPDQSDRAGFEATVGTQLDPRAFQFERMTQPQRVTYVKNLSPTDKAAVQQSYNFAHGAGLFAPSVPQ